MDTRVGHSGGSTTSMGEIKGNSYVPAFLSVCAVFCVGLNALFTFFYNHVDPILHYGRLFLVYGSCPIMVVLWLLLCRTKDASRELKTFKRVHLVVYTAGFAFVAYMTNFIFTSKDLIFFPQITGNGLQALCLLSLCFAPIFVMGIFSGIWAFLRRKKPSVWMFREISYRSMQLLRFGNLILISIPLLIVVFFDAFEPGKIGSFMFLLFAMPFLLLILFLASAIIYFPYKLMSRKF